MATSIYQFAELPRVKGPALAPARSDREPGAPPRVGVIYNPRSHRNKGADFDCGISPQIHIARPGDRSQLPDALAEFASSGIDLLVINGGDGTVRDVLTCGASIFGDTWPTIAVLPKGKTNALTVDLGLPLDWSLQNAIHAFASGGRIVRRPLEITPINDGASVTRDSRVLGFIMGAGAFTTATEAGQSAHRLGAFNAMAVGVTIGWVVLQWVFASRDNPWRRGARMQIGLGADNVPMGHSGLGNPEWRQIMFASTLETMPAGFKPFGPMRKGLKMAVTDQFSRRSLGLLLKMIRGSVSPQMREKGFHRISTPQFTLDIDDNFILDGEAFPGGKYRVAQGPELEFVTP